MPTGIAGRQGGNRAAGPPPRRRTTVQQPPYRHPASNLRGSWKASVKAP